MNDMRADLDAAMDEMGVADDVHEEIIEPTPVEDTPDVELSETEPETPDSEASIEAQTDADTPIPTETTTEATTTDNVDVSKSLKAPTGWTPKERENWSKVPPDLQQRISAREQEMDDLMANTKDSRVVHERMSQLANSYAPVLAAEGVNDPVQAAEGLFKTVAQLRMGSAAQKAQTIAQLVNHYGVDITSLDNALVGVEQPVASQTSEVEQRVAEQMQPFNQVMEMLQKASTEKTEAAKTDAAAAVTQFAANAEFINDVRNPMADLIDAASARGQDLSLEKAYNMACLLDPEISQVLEQRKANESLMAASNTLEGKRKAATSLNGRRSGVATHQGGINRRSDLLQAWDDAVG